MNGFVIVNKNLGTYYNGYANFVKDLRDAKIYHTEKGAIDTANYQHAKRGSRLSEFLIKPIKIELVEEN